MARMRKILIVSVLILAAVVLATAALAPVFVPPYVEREIRNRLSAFGLAADAHVKMRYRWIKGPVLDNGIYVGVVGTPWRFGANLKIGPAGLDAAVHMDETSFDQDDPLLKRLLEQHPPKGVTNLLFSGSVALDATATASPLRPMPAWEVRIPLRNLKASASTGEKTLTLDALSLTASASGIADHYDVAPLHVKAKSFAADDLALTDIRANALVSEKSLLLTDATAGFCGGSASIYALRLDVETLNAGLTFLLDEIDAGEALAHLRGFRGTASGRLHGKIRLFARKGGESLRVREAFLYSVPGEAGTIRLKSPEEFAENLALVGLDAATGKNLTVALTDLEYNVLKLDLARGEGNEATLSTRIAGTARNKGLSVPVDVTVNLHGEIEQILNLGLEYSNKLKGMKQ